MRILITADSSGFGGVERKAIENARLLSSSGHKVFLDINNKCPASVATELRDLGISLVSLPISRFVEEWKWRRTARMLSMIQGGAKLKALRLDVVHVCFTWATYGVSRAVIARDMNVPWIMSIHGVLPKLELSNWQERWLSYAFEGCRGGYAVSQRVRESFLMNVSWSSNAGGLSVIPEGVDVAQFTPDANLRNSLRRALGVSESEPLVVSVGRLAQSKRVDTVVEAFGVARAKLGGGKLLLVGDGPERARIEGLIESYGLAGDVVVLGFQDDPRPSLYAADMFISASEREGFPLSTLEAMATGLPCVLSGIAEHIEAFGDCKGVRCVPTYETRSYADALIELWISEKDDRSTGALSRAFVEERYSKTRRDALIRRFYENALEF